MRQAYRQIPADMRKAAHNLDIVVEEWPGKEDLELLEEPGTLFGLYTGVPLSEREGYGPALPDRITIYRQPILRSCSSSLLGTRTTLTTLSELIHPDKKLLRCVKLRGGGALGDFRLPSALRHTCACARRYRA